ncbi:hypothetical protein [Paraburkholderia sp. MM5384-R2]|uniref:hypothetical protein n=1 Tax=Paraburkholderia sp. MM5384-R2 TaxID=2723097 RepID=UPI001619F978|nr:hypothetical protein [Paraburkholderia sp. MM5384-R2]MBB5498082.1 hypothetical protein [Paraburkholderia sp. MM5384-R2]
MGIFYAAVDEDPLTSHEDSHVIAREGHRAATVKGDDGKTRSVVYIGDSAWCGACQSTGVIVGGAGISENRRMIDLAEGLAARLSVEMRFTATARPRRASLRFTERDGRSLTTHSLKQRALRSTPPRQHRLSSQRIRAGSPSSTA